MIRPPRWATTGSDIKLVVALTMLCALLYLPGLASLPVTDRDEARFAQATHQMLASADYWRIEFHDTARTRKPHGIHWLQSLSVGALGTPGAKEIWAYRVPSALGGWIAVILTYLLARRLFNRPTGALAAAFLAASPLMFVEAHIATADAALLASIVAAQLAVARVYIAARRSEHVGTTNAALFWTAIVCSALIKGPVGPLVIALTVIALVAIERRIGWLGALWPLSGAVIAGIILAVWSWRADQALGGSFIGSAMGEDFMPKLLAGQESHGLPPGTHTLIAVGALGAAFVFTGFGVVHAARNFSDGAFRFCLAWLVPYWIAIELAPTKLPQYALPAYPALAMLAAAALWAGPVSGAAGRAASLAMAGAVGCAAVAAIVLSDTLEAMAGVARADTAAIACLAILGALAVAVTGRQGRAGRAAAMAICAYCVVMVAVIAHTAGRTTPLWMSGRIAAAMDEAGAGAARGRASVGYHEPSLVFAAGRRIAFVGTGDAAARAGGATPPVIAVDQDHRPDFEARARALGRELSPVAAVTGFQYSKGRWTTVWIYSP